MFLVVKQLLARLSAAVAAPAQFRTFHCHASINQNVEEANCMLRRQGVFTIGRQSPASDHTVCHAVSFQTVRSKSGKVDFLDHLHGVKEDKWGKSAKSTDNRKANRYSAKELEEQDSEVNDAIPRKRKDRLRSRAHNPLYSSSHDTNWHDFSAGGRHRPAYPPFGQRNGTGKTELTIDQEPKLARQTYDDFLEDSDLYRDGMLQSKEMAMPTNDYFIPGDRNDLEKTEKMSSSGRKYPESSYLPSQERGEWGRTDLTGSKQPIIPRDSFVTTRKADDVNQTDSLSSKTRTWDFKEEPSQERAEVARDFNEPIKREKLASEGTPTPKSKRNPWNNSTFLNDLNAGKELRVMCDRKLTQALTKASSPTDLYSIMVENENLLNAIHISAAYSKMLNFCSYREQMELEQVEVTLDLLRNLASRHLPTFRLRQATNTLDALSKIARVYPESICDTLVTALDHHLRKLMTHSSYIRPIEITMLAINAYRLKLLEEQSDSNRSTKHSSSYADASAHSDQPKDLLDAIGRAVVYQVENHPGSFEPERVALLFSVLARVGRVHSDMLDALSREILRPDTTTADPEEVKRKEEAMKSRGFALYRIQRFLQEDKELVPARNMSPNHLLTVAHSCLKLNYNHNILWTALSNRAITLVRENEMSPGPAAELLAIFGERETLSRSYFEPLLSVVLSTMDVVPANDLAKALPTVVSLGFKGEPRKLQQFMGLAAVHLLPLLHNLLPEALCQAVHGCSAALQTMPTSSSSSGSSASSSGGSSSGGSSASGSHASSSGSSSSSGLYNSDSMSVAGSMADFSFSPSAMDDSEEKVMRGMEAVKQLLTAAAELFLTQSQDTYTPSQMANLAADLAAAELRLPTFFRAIVALLLPHMSQLNNKERVRLARAVVMVTDLQPDVLPEIPEAIIDKLRVAARGA